MGNKYQEALNIFCEHNTFKDIPKDILNEKYLLLQELVDKTTWIPVEKKLPPMFVKVLITYEDKYLNPHINVAYINESHEWIYPLMNNYKYRVIAWMPLPKPYLGSDKDEC
ncbi:MAG: hypothetical protein ACLSU6_06400 [Thomasclavelia ramosa]|uniref:DUF551 domain-containing protein n=1 Tax=Siphoviridae sp. ctNZc11 TaxID=2827858 RepID=A0A8S5TBU6_9CAUD|nr:MAG TPA: Protein of unknown function (DUF551) [Siphoviridae sp. ctNZc11]